MTRNSTLLMKILAGIVSISLVTSTATAPQAQAQEQVSSAETVITLDSEGLGRKAHNESVYHYVDQPMRLNTSDTIRFGNVVLAINQVLGAVAALFVGLLAIVGIVVGTQNDANGSSSDGLGSSTDEDPGVPERTDVGGITTGAVAAKLADPTAEITASAIKAPEEALTELEELSHGFYVSPPIDYSADPEVAAQGVTLTMQFDEPLPADALYAFTYWDEESEVWVPVDTTISADRMTATAIVDHLSLWSFLTDAGKEIKKHSQFVVKKVASGAKKAVTFVNDGMRAIANVGNKQLASYNFDMTGYSEAPTCSSSTPSWYDGASGDISFNDASTTKMCVGQSPKNPNNLEMKVVVSRLSPYEIRFTQQPTHIYEDNSSSDDDDLLEIPIDTVVSTLGLDDIGTGFIRGVLGGTILVPGRPMIFEFSEQDFKDQGNTIQVGLKRIDPAGALFYNVLQTLPGALGGEVIGAITEDVVMLALTWGAFASSCWKVVDGLLEANNDGNLYKITTSIAGCMPTAFRGIQVSGEKLVERNVFAKAGGSLATKGEALAKKADAVASILVLINGSLKTLSFIRETLVDFARGVDRRNFFLHRLTHQPGQCDSNTTFWDTTIGKAATSKPQAGSDWYQFSGVDASWFSYADLSKNQNTNLAGLGGVPDTSGFDPCAEFSHVIVNGYSSSGPHRSNARNGAALMFKGSEYVGAIFAEGPRLPDYGDSSITMSNPEVFDVSWDGSGDRVNITWKYDRYNNSSGGFGEPGYYTIQYSWQGSKFA